MSIDAAISQSLEAAYDAAVIASFPAAKWSTLAASLDSTDRRSDPAAHVAAIALSEQAT